VGTLQACGTLLASTTLCSVSDVSEIITLATPPETANLVCPIRPNRQGNAGDGDGIGGEGIRYGMAGGIGERGNAQGV